MTVAAKGAALFNHKINAFVQGRRQLFSSLKTTLQAHHGPIIWAHCASLGEFEQGRPIIDQLKQTLPSYRILITFFSPSGYEYCKRYEAENMISYLPWDTRANANKFVSMVNPKLVLFIKYEFWFNLIHEIQQRGIPIILASALFRKEQVFFKPYGSFFRALLHRYDHFFVQDVVSQQLLRDIGITRTTVAGDSRVDRVYQIAQHASSIPMVERFAATHPVWIVGSCWPRDISLLIPFIRAYGDRIKFVVAPHEISESFLSNIEHDLPVKSVRYSQAGEDIVDARVLLIDNIGMLSRLYRYGKFAYVGGGLDRGVHNILEAACYGIPIFFGNTNYKKFKEAVDLTTRGAAFAIGNTTELIARYNELAYPSAKYRKACETARAYILENRGCTDKVVSYCKERIATI